MVVKTVVYNNMMIYSSVFSTRYHEVIVLLGHKIILCDVCVFDVFVYDVVS